jgi:hypothetical protein
MSGSLRQGTLCQALKSLFMFTDDAQMTKLSHHAGTVALLPRMDDAQRPERGAVISNTNSDGSILVWRPQA